MSLQCLQNSQLNVMYKNLKITFSTRNTNTAMPLNYKLSQSFKAFNMRNDLAVTNLLVMLV